MTSLPDLIFAGASALLIAFLPLAFYYFIQFWVWAITALCCRRG